MTLDVKALRAAAAAAERAYAKRGATYSMWRTAATAARTLYDLCTPASVLALLDRLERAEREREEALRAYAATWKLLDEMTDEGRGIHDLEAAWLYTEQPAAVWDALRAAGIAPARLTSEPSR